MFASIRRRVTVGNIALVLALLFAMGGGAYAAKKFIITSKNQIAPKVIAALKGAQGPQGPAGKDGAVGKEGLVGKEGKEGIEGKQGPAGKEGPMGPTGAKGAIGTTGSQGATGATGPKGATGEPWTPNSTLPKGATETGEWQLVTTSAAKEEVKTTTLSFPIRLAESPTVHFIKLKAAPPAGCTGTVANPGAQAPKVGEKPNLCIFEGELEGVRLGHLEFFVAEDASGHEEAGTTGAELIFLTTGTGGASVEGTWALTG